MSRETDRKTRQLENQLQGDEAIDGAAIPKIKSFRSVKGKYKTGLGTGRKDQSDVIDILLRSSLAVLMALFLSAVSAGLIEVASGIDIEFGSVNFFLIIMPQIILFFILFYKIFSHTGPFKRRYAENHVSSGRDVNDDKVQAGSA